MYKNSVTRIEDSFYHCPITVSIQRNSVHTSITVFITNAPFCSVYKKALILVSQPPCFSICFSAEMKTKVSSWLCCRLVHELFVTIVLVAGCSMILTYQLLKYIPSHIHSSQLNIHFKSTVDIYRQFSVDPHLDTSGSVGLASASGGRQRKGRRRPPRDLIEKLQEVGAFGSTRCCCGSCW